MWSEETESYQNDPLLSIYYRSDMISTKAQRLSLNCILDLTVDYSDVRGMFKQMDAINVIFRACYSNSRLSSRARRVLVCLRDSEVNTLLQEWTEYFPGHIRRVYVGSMWDKIAPYLQWVAACFIISRVSVFITPSTNCPQ